MTLLQKKCLSICGYVIYSCFVLDLSIEHSNLKLTNVFS